MTTKYDRIKDIKNIINQDVIKEVMTTGKKILSIYYKVIHGVLVMVSSDNISKFDVDGTVKIIQQLMKDTKKKYNFSDKFIFTYTIPTLTVRA